LRPLPQWKRTIITYSECVFIALVVQYARRMRSNIKSSATSSALRDFFFLNYLINFGGKLLNMKFVFGLSLQILSENFLIPKGIKAIYKYAHTASYKLPIILIRFSRWIFQKYPIIEFHDPSRRSRVVHCCWTDRQIRLS
jgi:hypothetical protein